MSNSKIWNGVIAGFFATIALSALMIGKQLMGIMPQLNPITMMSKMMGATTPLIGWMDHFLIGTIFWGVLFSLLQSKLPGPYWLRGAIFATGAWLISMVMVMPMAGGGLFGIALGLGVMASVAALILHWIYGAVLGGVYGALITREHALSRTLRHS